MSKYFSISGQISWSNVSGTSFITGNSQYLLLFPGSAWTNKGFKSKSSKFGDALLTCINKSVLPIISFNDLNPNSARISLTSVAIKVKRFTILSGVPVNFSLNFSSWVQTPTGHVFEWHCLTIIHPIATKAVVATPYSSAPIIAAITTSLPVFIPPSVLSVTLCLKLFNVKTWLASVRPISHGIPTYFTLVCGVAPVPPLWPEIRIMSAFALATPAAIVPTPEDATNLTPILAFGLICFKSYINWAKSSIEYISWWGGGDIKVTPGVECLNLAISSVTLKPGNCPPSPGFAPCAILISISLQLFK